MIVDDPFLKKCKIKNENYRDKSNNSTLHISVSNNSMKMVKYFLGKKIKNVNVKNDKGKTALHLACTTGNEDMINLLLKNGADVNALDDQGNKPFDLISTERSKN
jgi:ankyrin repeat protein